MTKLYEDTVMCQVCGVSQPIIRSLFRRGKIMIPEHTCQRYLVATYYVDARAVRVWTSRRPGVTGPTNLVRLFGAHADRWRVMDSLTGMAFHWEPMPAPEEVTV